MTSTRRDFVARLAAVTAAGIAARPALLSALDRYPRAGDPMLEELSARALEAARAAGATYADVRFTLTRSEDIWVVSPGIWGTPVNDEHAAVGIRALADGAWGFAASNLWTPDDVARLGREATIQAKVNAQGRNRRVEIGSPPPVVVGRWVSPVQRDPFSVPLAEKLDVILALHDAVGRVDAPVGVGAYSSLQHRRQEKTFASTDGTFVTQTLYLSHPYMQVSCVESQRYASRTFDKLQPGAFGWETWTEASLARDIPQLVEEVVQMLDGEPVDPDRYDIVCDGFTTARLAGATIGVAAELDRVLGYEANATGTSYLAPPEEMLGKFALGPSRLNVVANRSHPGALATVEWDDEGIVPDEYEIVKDGVLVDYHTTRDLASQRRSRGCASSDNARNITLLHAPNIAMLPGPADTSFEDLVAGLERGLVVVGGAAFPGGTGPVTTDRQQLNGEINGSLVYEVRNGKRTRYIRNSEVLFRAPELWKGLQAIGGARSVVWTGLTVWKGQPSQQHNFGVGGVPARFSGVPVTDRSRQA